MKESVSVSVAIVENSQYLPLQEFIQGVIVDLKSRNSTYTFGPVEKINANVFKLPTEVVKMVIP